MHLRHLPQIRRVGLPAQTWHPYAGGVPRDLLSTGEAAELLGVDASTVLRYVRRGRLPAITLPSGHLRIKREDVEKLLKAGSERDDPEP